MIRPTEPTVFASAEELLDADLIARLGRLDVSSRRVFAGKLKGERRSKRRGDSVEFADHRPYAVGDDLRHIDWNVFARLDALVMKLFLEEEDLSLHVVVDCSASMDAGSPTKLAYAQRAAMALAYVGLVRMNRVALTALGASSGSGDLVQSLRDLRGRRRLREAAEFLCRVRPGEPGVAPDLRGACRRIAMSRRGRGVMVLLTDLLWKEGYVDAVGLLAGRGYDLCVVQVLSAQEVDPMAEPVMRGDLRLLDVEDGDRAEITVSRPVLDRYRATVRAYRAEAARVCAQRETAYIAAQSDEPIDRLLSDAMRRKGVLR